MVSYLKGISQEIFQDTEEEGGKKITDWLLTNKNLKVFSIDNMEWTKALHVLSLS